MRGAHHALVTPRAVAGLPQMDDTAPRPDQGAADGGEAEEAYCWICLSEGTPDAPLSRVCECPRECHQDCLARWQLHCAGKRCVRRA